MAEGEETSGGFHFFGGTIHVIDPLHDEKTVVIEKLKEAERRLTTGEITNAGIDFEWTPDFGIPISQLSPENPGNPIALIQVALCDWVLVYRHFEEFPLPLFLAEFLTSVTSTKYVLAFDLCDKLKLKSTFDLEIPPCTLSEVANDGDGGLKRLALLRGGWDMRKSKSVGISIWGERSSRLSEAQIHYAAEDAWFTLLLGLKKDNHSSLTPDSALLHLKRSRGDLKRRIVSDELWTQLRTDDERRVYLTNDDIFEIQDNQVKRRKLQTLTDQASSLNLESVLTGLERLPVGQFVTDRVLIAGITGRDPLDVSLAEKRQLESLATANVRLLDFSYDGDRRLGLYRLIDHPRQTTRLRVEERLAALLKTRDEARCIGEVVEESLGNLTAIGMDTEDETRLIYSLLSKVKIASDRLSGLDVDTLSYKKHALNLWVRQVRQSFQP